MQDYAAWLLLPSDFIYLYSAFNAIYRLKQSRPHYIIIIMNNTH